MIRVASYNIRKGIGTDRRRRPERILGVLAEIDADVICLQEADRRFGARAQVIDSGLLEQTPWCAVPFGTKAASMGWHGNAILVRASAQIIDFEAIELPALEPRGAVMADIGFGDTRLRVVGMHLDLSGLWRRRQANAILERVAEAPAETPIVMMGDLNEWSAATGAMHLFNDGYRVADTGPSFHSRRPVARLDKIIVSPQLRVIACGVHDSETARIASDHLPIWATVERA